MRFTEAAHVKDFMASTRVKTNPADDFAWFRLLPLHVGIGRVHARRWYGGLGLADPHRWEEWKALPTGPAAVQPGGGGTITGLADAAGRERTADRAGAILTALDAPVRERYPDVGIRIPIWNGWSTRRRPARRCTTRWSSWRSIRRVPADLAGPPRLDDDYLVLSTILSAKGLEWRVVQLAHLVDGAVPSDMAVEAGPGWRRNGGSFYVAVTRGAGPAVPVRAAADASSPDGQRRPARLRPADPVPRSGRPGRV